MKSKSVLVIYGLPGVGKTTACQALRLLIDARYHGVDDIWRNLPAGSSFTPKKSSQVFSMLLIQVSRSMEVGLTPILVEGVFTSVRRIKAMRALASSFEYQCRFYLLRCGRAATFDRLSRREPESGRRQPGMFEIWHLLSEKMDSCHEADLVIDTEIVDSREVAECIHKEFPILASPEVVESSDV